MIYEIVNESVVARTTEVITTDFDLARKFMQKYEDAWDEGFPLDLVIVEHDEDDLRRLLDGDIKLYDCWTTDRKDIGCKEVSILNWSEHTMDIEEVGEIDEVALRVAVYAKNESDAIAQARDLFNEYEKAEEIDTEDALEDVEPPKSGQIVINSQGTVIMNKATYLNLLEKNL